MANVVKAFTAKEHFYKEVLEQMEDGVITYNSIDGVVNFNKEAKKLHGIEDETSFHLKDLLLHKWYLNKDKEPMVYSENPLIRVINGEVLNHEEFWLKTPNGELVNLLACGSQIISNGMVLGAVIVLHDNTQYKTYEEQIKHFAFHDIITNLPNRRKLKERLKKMIEQEQSSECMLAVFFLDLDFFKLVNDHYGHEVGDILLKDVAHRLVTTLPKSAIISRIGGDEFVIAVPNIKNQKGVSAIAKKIRQALTLPFLLQKNQVHITASIGISVYPEDGVEISTLINYADQAMYMAKRSGKNNFQFYLGQEARTSDFTAIDLHNAITNDQFKLVYQPKINIETNQIEGVEALLRWVHPQLGMIPPDKFIPLAEDTDLIIPIGEWVLKEACLQAKAWENKGFQKVRVAVNISPKQFESDTIISTVKRTLKETHLDPSLLELELTERITTKDIGFVTKTLNELDELGVKISLDDFGKGYSSLNYLKNFPIDVIKIDKGFIHDCTNSEKDAFIIKAIITMAKGLNVKVLAEGVETKEQLKFLSLLGCDEVQGYYFCKPVTSEKIAEQLK